MNQKKVLFVCKYNRFRSKIAESYYKKVRPGHPVRSRGLIQGKMNRNEKEVYLPKKLGLDIQQKPHGLHYSDLEWADYVIIVANNLPKKLFKSKRIENKVIKWNIPDVYPNTTDEKIYSVVLKIIRKVDNLKIN